MHLNAKVVLLIGMICFSSGVVDAQLMARPDSTQKIQVVEAACGECQFKLPGKGCHLAVRMEGKAYFVDGTSIDEHGDAHAGDGFCNAIRKAEVQGKLIDKRFAATYFKLLPVTKEKPVKGQ